MERCGFGSNNLGQLGNNNTVVYSSPIQLPGTQWDASSAGDGGGHSGGFMGITKTDGTLWVWGNNASGQLGINDKVHRHPVQVLEHLGLDGEQVRSLFLDA